MINKHMKRCSVLLINREMQVKTTRRYHLTQVRIAIIKKKTKYKSGEDAGKRDPSYTVNGKILISWYSHSADKLVQQ